MIPPVEMLKYKQPAPTARCKSVNFCTLTPFSIMNPLPLKLFGPLKSCYDLFNRFRENRTPIRLKPYVDSHPVPTVAITVTNISPTISVFVHGIRVHFGNEVFSRAFKLHPSSTVSLAPKARKTWVLSYEPSQTILIERTSQKERPKANSPDSQPGIESPAQLFNAIGMGDKNHSWIEVDFNEYSKRQFARGQIKSIFDSVGMLKRELRKIEADTNRSEQESGSNLLP